jgi:hypothetical protein
MGILVVADQPLLADAAPRDRAATRTPWTSPTTAPPPWNASASTLATPTALLPAGLLRGPEPRVVPAHAGRVLLGDPFDGDLRVGQVVDAVLAHAPGERQRLLALLGAGRGLAAVGQVLLAGLLGRLELRAVA